MDKSIIDTFEKRISKIEDGAEESVIMSRVVEM